MKGLVAALALAALIAVPTFAPPVNAAPVSPASSSFGSNRPPWSLNLFSPDGSDTKGGS